MELRVLQKDNIYMIAVKGKLGLYNSLQLRDLTAKMLKRKVTRLIINLEGVDSIDSSGIGALIHICSNAKKMDIRLAITNIQDQVMESIDLTKVSGYIPVAENMAQALTLVSG